MPLHDWTRVPDAAFHGFHLGWLWNLAGVLNASVLPPGYIARPEEYVGPYQADVLALETGGGGGAARPSPSSPKPTLTIAPPPFVQHKERRVAIFSGRDERRVSVIELVSPGNKDSAVRAEWFRRKLLDYLEAGLHLLVIDLLPPTGLVLDGFADALVHDLGCSEKLRGGGPQTCAFECQIAPPRVQVYAAELAVGAPLPSAPLFLEPSIHVEIPLEESYLETVERLPAKDREQLERPRAK